MTRETKVGAVVAISFLSLVGVVVVSKWRNQGTTSNDGAPVVAQKDNQDPEHKASPQPAEPKPIPKSGIENAKFEQPVLVSGLPNKLPGGEESNNNALPALPTLDPAKLPPLPAMSEDEKRKQLAEQIARENSETPMLPPLPNPVVVQPNSLDKTLENAAAKIEQAKKNTADAVNQGANTLANGLDEFFTRANDKLNKDAAKLDKQANERINQGVNQLDKNAARMNDKVNGAVQVANDKVNKAANKADQQLEDLLKQGNAELNKAADKVNSALPPLPPLPAPVSSEKPGDNSLAPLPAAVGANASAPLPKPVTDKDKLPTISDKDKLPALPQPALNNGLPAPAPLPSVVNSAEPRPMIPAPANNPLGINPLGNPPVIDAKVDAKPSVPPIPAPGSPQVRDSETINYTIKGGETLEAISKARYGSDKYAKAILAYNRDFSPTGKLLTTVLQPGQNVLLPSAEFLQDRYSAAIGANSIAAISINPPIPAPAPMPTPTPGANTAAGKTYRVPAQGQFLFEIAIRTLGDGNRWSEIYRLNPNINPQQPIPGGTELKLPANAKLP